MPCPFFSQAGKVGSTISASYSASKHAIQGYFNALRSEVGFRGISVHLACPGPVATPIQEHAFAETAGAKVDTSKPDTTKRMTAAVRACSATLPPHPRPTLHLAPFTALCTPHGGAAAPWRV